MAYGQHSWIAVVALFAVMAVRMLGSRHRRGQARPGGPVGARGFTSAPTDARPDAAQAPGTGFTGTDPGWFTDPFVRHEQRYWSGTAWTEHVQDRGTPSVDPPPPPRS